MQEHGSLDLLGDLTVGSNNNCMVRVISDVLTSPKSTGSLQIAAAEISGSNFFANVFRKLCPRMGDGVVQTGEPPAPGKDSVTTAIIPAKSKFRPLWSEECAPKMGAYITMALCRQRLHDDALRVWTTSILNQSLNQLARTCLTSKNKVCNYQLHHDYSVKASDT